MSTAGDTMVLPNGICTVDRRGLIMEKTRRGGAWVLGIGMFLLYFAVLLAIVHVVGTDAELYHQLQMRAGILPEAGISEEELVELDGSLADYLAGDFTALDESPFNERELTHMEDCFRLFALLRRVLLVCGLLAVAMLFLAEIKFKCRSYARAALLGALALLGAILLLGIWGMIDFDSLFTAFHHLLFTNDLWLLDPRTDLLIRICPQSMFVNMALRIAGFELAFIALMNAIYRVPALMKRWMGKGAKRA